MRDARTQPARPISGGSLPTAPDGFFGNQLGIGYAGPVDLTTAINVPYTFGLAALNAADNQVLAIRKNTNLSPVIYSIGYFGGTEAPNQAWLQRIANDPASTSFDATYPAGLFVSAPTTGPAHGRLQPRGFGNPSSVHVTMLAGRCRTRVV